MLQIQDHNLKAREAWNINAKYWDERMAEGNDFFNELVWPSVEKLLQPITNKRILDIACGNGLTSRRLASMKAKVTAFDFSEEMIQLAKSKNSQEAINYYVIDATDKEALLRLGTFDAALCNMAFMDMAEIKPLMEALSLMLTIKGSLVFSIMHPCFNNPSSVQMGELEDRGGNIVITYSIKISRYMLPYIQNGLAMHGQPVPHPYFHRSLSMLLKPCFEAGFVIDAIEERSFSPEKISGTTALSWNGHFSEIPPVLNIRLKRI